jgi:hypothetical protein
MIIAFIISQVAFHFEAQIQKYIWTGFEWHISAGSNVIMTTLLTVISVVRGYAWRRHFNAKVATEESILIDALKRQTKEGVIFRVGSRGGLFKKETKHETTKK